MIALGLTSISAVFDAFIPVNQTTISLRVIFIFGELLFWGGLQLVDVHVYILEPHIYWHGKLDIYTCNLQGQAYT